LLGPQASRPDAEQPVAPPSGWRSDRFPRGNRDHPERSERFPRVKLCRYRCVHRPGGQTHPDRKGSQYACKLVSPGKLCTQAWGARFPGERSGSRDAPAGLPARPNAADFAAQLQVFTPVSPGKPAAAYRRNAKFPRGNVALLTLTSWRNTMPQDPIQPTLRLCMRKECAPRDQGIAVTAGSRDGPFSPVKLDLFLRTMRFPRGKSSCAQRPIFVAPRVIALVTSRNCVGDVSSRHQLRQGITGRKK